MGVSVPGPSGRCDRARCRIPFCRLRGFRSGPLLSSPVLPRPRQEDERRVYLRPNRRRIYFARGSIY